MKHVFVVAYHFPPAGGVPVRRVLRFVRHLPALGWRCSVITADGAFDPFHPDDPEGLARLPQVARILRVPARAGLERAFAWGWDRLRGAIASGGSGGDSSGGRLRRRLHETLWLPDAKRAWGVAAARAGRELARTDPPDAILATGFPWSAFRAGEAISRETGVPLVLDYRDAWTTNPRDLWSGPRNRALEAAALGQASAVLTATDGIRDALRAAFPETRASIETLRNAHDPEERPAPDPTLADPDRLVVTFTGTFNDAYPPGPLDQSPYHLIEAVSRLGPDVRRGLRLRLVGRVAEPYRRQVAELGLSDTVEVHPSVPHPRALQHQSAADVLVVIVCAGQGGQGVLTGKVLEYVGAGRPILALTPEGELADFVRGRGLGWVEPTDDVGRIAERLAALVAEHRAGTLPRTIPPQPDCDAAAQTRVLAGVLGRVSG